MNKLVDWMSNVFGPKASAFARNPWIAAIQETMVATMPVMLISSFITILGIIIEYVPSFPDFSYISTFTMGLSAIMVAMLLPTFILEKLRLPKYKRQAGFMGIVVLMCMSMATITDDYVFTINPDAINASGMFVAIVAGLFVAFVMKFFSNRSLFKKDTSMPKFLTDSFDSMAPIIVIMVIMYVLCGLLGLDIYALVNTAISPLINIAQSCFGITFIMFLMAFFYSFGLSPWLLTPVYYTVGMDAIAKNAAAVAAGEKATLILTNETLGGWIWIGGTGCTLTLCILFIAVCKSAKLKGLGKTCIVPGIFNINEPIVFGSIVFNPILMVPFWINPIVVTVITYVAMSIGAVTVPSQSMLLWYLPLPIQTYLTNYDFRGVILVLLLMVLTTVIWYPFVKVYDKQCLEEEQANKNNDK